MNRLSTKVSWFAVNLILPLIPFFAGGIIRYVTTSLSFSWETFSASEMAICLALLSFFINQSLVLSDRVLDNVDKRKEVETQAMIYLIFGSAFLVLFAMITAFDCAVSDLHVLLLSKPLHIFEIVVFVAAPFLVLYSVRTQRSYRLKASLI